MMYLCELINGNIVRERFFRKGESAKAVKRRLEYFVWGPGEWRISDPDEAVTDFDGIDYVDYY